MIRRWIEGQTFAPRAGAAGVQLLDAQAARYGEFDEVFLVGLVEGEWPQRSSEEHLLSGVASEPARLARLAHGAGRRARRFPGSDGARAAPGASLHLRARERRHHRSERVSRGCRSAWAPHCRVATLGRAGRHVCLRGARERSGRAFGCRRRGVGWLALRTAQVGGGRGTVSRHRRVVSSRPPTASARSSAISSARSRFFAERVLEPSRKIPKTKPR